MIHRVGRGVRKRGILPNDSPTKRGPDEEFTSRCANERERGYVDSRDIYRAARSKARSILLYFSLFSTNRGTIAVIRD